MSPQYRVFPLFPALHEQFSHLGMGEGIANIVMMLALALVAVFAIRWLMKKRQHAGSLQPAMQYAGMPAGIESPRSAHASMPLSAGSTGAAAAATATANVPADFDVEGFLRQAKLNFIRLQATNDRGDMDDIRQFCTLEMAAEIQMQFQERNQLAQETDIMQLNAELLDVSSEANRALASVRFSGQLREEANGAAEAFSEVWQALTRAQLLMKLGAAKHSGGLHDRCRGSRSSHSPAWYRPS
jgi:predicted lipid-binding transport protein (Tim44 family)